ncbi:MAG TPA: SUF system NifU family Fe-S cluster assembly protein [Dehalococcoidia bacterium]|nr:SUF system NifU family Fe-S cluster assembly protein [Dehalococcoidia bacterium]
MNADAELDELYRDVIVEHYRRPHHAAPLARADASAEGMNPLCGDEVRVELRFDGDRVAEGAAWGRGCAICQASASMMTDEITGLAIDDAERLIGAVEAMLKSGAEPDEDLGDLDALRGVAKFPVRVKCALLPWKVLRDALDERGSSES